jgi:hypothetical protein
MMLIYLSPALLLVMGSYLLILAPPQADEALVCYLLAVGLIVLNLALTYPCRYTLTTDSLNIRCGLVTKSIALDQICGVELSSSCRSAPALSLRRVRIRYNKGQTLVSPLEREPFILDLTEAIARLEASRQGAPS